MDKWFILFTKLPSATDKPPDEILLEAWHELFDREDPELLNRACARAFAECKFFPSPAEITERLAKPEQVAKDDRALVEWEAIAEYCRKGYHPDLGWSGKQPTISAQAEYALRHAGGWIGVARCLWDEPDNLVFRKRDFADGYKKFSEMEAVGYVPLSQAEAKRMLGLIPKLELPPVPGEPEVK